MLMLIHASLVWFLVRTAQSQQSNSTECEPMLFVTNHIPYLWALSNSFSNSFIDFWQLRSCFIKWHEKERIKLSIASHPYGGCFTSCKWLQNFEFTSSKWLLNFDLLHVSGCKVFTFCDILHETKQTTQINSWECAVQTGNHLKELQKPTSTPLA